eukprot:2820675-Prymnesium_polylepis.1
MWASHRHDNAEEGRVGHAARGGARECVAALEHGRAREHRERRRREEPEELRAAFAPPVAVDGIAVGVVDEEDWRILDDVLLDRLLLLLDGERHGRRSAQHRRAVQVERRALAERHPVGHGAVGRPHVGRFGDEPLRQPVLEELCGHGALLVAVAVLSLIHI